MKDFWPNYWDLIMGVVLIALAMIVPSHLLGLVITLVIGIYAFYRPKRALLFLFIYVPARPTITAINPGLKAIEDAIILFTFFRVVYNSRTHLKDLFKLHVFEWAFILYCIYGAFAGVFITGVPVAAVIFQMRAFLLFYLLFYIIRRLNVTKEDILKALWIVFIMSMVLAVHGWIEKVSIRSWLMPYEWTIRPLSSTNRIRIYGLIDNPNTLAVYFGFAYIMVLYLKSFYSGKIRIWFHIGAVVILGTTILTWSRGSFLAIIFASICYLLLTRNWQYLKQSLIYLVLGFVLVSLPIMGLTGIVDKTKLGETQHKIMSQYDQSQTSAAERLAGTLQQDVLNKDAKTGRLFFVKKGLAYFSDHPITGTGFDTFGDSATLSYPSPLYDKYNIDPGIHVYSDNQYIQVMAQTGLIGVVIFAFYLLGMLVLLWRKRLESPVLGKPLLAVLIGIFLMGLYYNIWELDVISLLYFPYLAILFPLNKKNEI